ncbi:MAG: hypothetical protein JWN70_763 [Planctomycetaceae bacterium]|nr:hypothetical protein [Planctomycetaceae bacterium]
MRIGIALFQFFPGRIGGVAEYIERLIPGLLKVMAADDELVLCGNRENLAPFDSLADSRLKRVPFSWSKRWIQCLRLADLILPGSPSSPFSRRLNALKLDVFFCPQQSIFPRGVRARTVVAVMDFLHYRCPDQLSVWQRWTRRRKEEHFTRVCDHAISISAATQADLQSYYKMPAEKCSVVHLAGRAVQTTVAPNPVPPGAPYIYFPAAAFPHKNHSRLLEAFRRYRESHPDTAARLLLSGQTSPRMEQLLRYQAAAGDVLHLGFVSSAEVAAIYAGSQGVIIPTLFEGFGMPVIEGLGYGRPVCCSDLPVFHELVGDAVRYFDPQSIESIQSAIADLFAARVAVPDAVRTAEILERLNWDRCAAETYAVLSK